MTAATNYLENEALDHVLAVAAMTAPANVYVKLHTGSPGEAATANAAGETTRVAASFAAASGGSASTDADVAWTDVSNAETYTHWSLWDAVTGGNALVYGAFSAGITVAIGDNFTIESGDLTVTLA